MSLLALSPEFPGDDDPALRRVGSEVDAARDRRHALDALRRGLLCGAVRAPHAFYVIEAGRFVPVAFHRLAPAPPFAAHGSLARAVRAMPGPVTTVGSHRARRLCAQLDEADRAALRAMGTIALLPFFAGEELVAFLCVGGGFDTFDAGRVARVVTPLVRRLDRERAAPAGEGAPPV